MYFYKYTQFQYRKYIFIICCINRFTSLCKNLFNFLEFLAEAFSMLDGPGARSRWTKQQHIFIIPVNIYSTCYYSYVEIYIDLGKYSGKKNQKGECRRV